MRVMYLWCWMRYMFLFSGVCMCSMLVCFTNYDKSLHLILVQPIPISPGWLKESLVPSFHQKNFCNKIGCTFLIQGIPDKSDLFYLNTSLLLLSRQMFRKSKLNEYLYVKSLSFCWLFATYLYTKWDTPISRTPCKCNYPQCW